MQYPYRLKIASVFLVTVLIFGTVSGVSVVTNPVYAQVKSEPTLDLSPPTFGPVSDVTVEATSISGSTVNYSIPSATDNVQVDSITCNPSPNTLFPIGQTTVICVVTDSSLNQATTSFAVIVHDTTPPEISIGNLELITNELLSVVDVGDPVVFDAVDSFPIVTNNATELFPLGDTKITWLATDSSGNTSTITQLITLTVLQPKIDGPSQLTIEATSPEMSIADIEFGVTGNSSLDFELTNNSTETFALGKTIVKWTIIDAADNVVEFLQEVTVVDTTAPKIDLAFNAYSLSKDRDEGTFSIYYAVRDNVDFSPEITATLNDIPVQNNQFVNLKFDENETNVKEKQGILEFSGTNFVLSVTASDFNQNENNESITTTFSQEPIEYEIPIDEIPTDELTIEDLESLLTKLETIPPSDLENLGQELHEFKTIGKLLFDQEKDAIKNLKDELKQKIKDFDGNKKSLKDDYNKKIKQAKADYKLLKDQYKDIFSEYKNTTKLMLKEKKSLENDKLAKELNKIETRLTQQEHAYNKEVEKEKNEKQQQQEARTNELFNMLISRINTNEILFQQQEIFNSVQTIVDKDIKSKEKQKLMQAILKNSDKSLKNEFKELQKEIKKNDKELKKSLKAQEKESKKKIKELKKLQKEQEKLSKLAEKELKKLEKQLAKIEKEKKKELEKQQKEQQKQDKKIQKQLEQEVKKIEKQLKKDAKQAEKEAKKAEKEAKKAEKEAKKAEKDAKKAEKEAKKEAKKKEKENKKGK